MPNWVYNTLSITGDEQEVARFKEQASKPYKTGWIDSHKPLGDQEMQVHEEPLSFWNFITPPAEHFLEYFEANGFSNGRKTGDTPWNWYNWNIENWGVKWDAGEVSLNTDTPKALGYSFETPWGIPQPVFIAMCEQFPTLEFNFYSIEEQGWGAEQEGHGGQLTLTKEWDIPNSHAEHEQHDQTCRCEWDDDPNDWYDDCPDKEEAIKNYKQEEEGNK
ncbi:hypothetical protein UFOVP223_39 [uncultured Caudovirales phage]|uniref:YubB ferredoxin-like domain-containing protein n=1 Tax=uncultured Caudovirales phage TaxID=2100421 RepID=A0A6J5L541_9CAUD|nr:hypothetical protein UFOVP110_125 [uncultured Caudovirales phage]CAB5219200.1 hypothetical protein UFOVP223_39 [uncultured Caudovirales phage]